MKGKPKDYKESQEWKDMESKIAEYERKEQIRNLTDRGVKNEKYAEMLIGKLDSEKDIDEQLSSFKEEYADMFNVEEETKPQFGSGTKDRCHKAMKNSLLVKFGALYRKSRGVK